MSGGQWCCWAVTLVGIYHSFPHDRQVQALPVARSLQVQYIPPPGSFVTVRKLMALGPQHQDSESQHRDSESQHRDR